MYRCTEEAMILCAWESSDCSGDQLEGYPTVNPWGKCTLAGDGTYKKTFTSQFEGSKTLTFTATAIILTAASII